MIPTVWWRYTIVKAMMYRRKEDKDHPLKSHV